MPIITGSETKKENKPEIRNENDDEEEEEEESDKSMGNNGPREKSLNSRSQGNEDKRADGMQVKSHHPKSNGVKRPEEPSSSTSPIATRDEEPLAKRIRRESDNDKKPPNNLTLEEFTDIVLASEGFENRSNSIRVKPVVLAPRTNGIHHHHAPNNPSTPSVVVSVKPRVHPPKRRYPLPSEKPLNVPSLVEEWFRKMKPPLGKEEEEETTEEAINLSLKSKPVYLRPNKNSSVTISAHPISYPKPPLSPPRLEIKKIPAGGKSVFNNYTLSRRQPHNHHLYNKPSPQTDPMYSDMRDAIKDRAFRDIHLAHTKDMHGNFPIHMSVLMRKSSLVRRYCCVLHILNSNVDLINDDKYTPLHLAVLDNSVEIVDLLLSFGADPSIKDHRGNSCFHQVRSQECLKLLVEHARTKEDLDAFNDLGITALQIAIKNNDPACVQTLIQSGANLNIPENYKAAYHHPSSNEHNKIMSERYLTTSSRFH